MKRFLLFLLIVLLIPITAGAAWMDDTAWIHSELSADRTPYVCYIYFAADGTCYYTTHLFHPNQDTASGRTHRGTWSLLPSGEVYAKTGENTDTTFMFSEDQEKAMDQNRRIFYQVYTFDLN